MNIIDGGLMYVHGPEHELPHTPGSDPNWQESFVLIWCDLEQSVGGYFRIGHEPHHKGGNIELFSNVFSPEGVFHRGDSLPLRADDNFGTGFNSGDDTLRYEYKDEQITWTMDDDNVSACLTVRDYGPAIDGYVFDQPEAVSDFVANHVDTACEVTGTVTVKGKIYEVCGIGIRDHGWGIRKWESLLSHRWTVAAFDEENHFIAMNFLTVEESIKKFGWVVRGDRAIRTKDVEIVAHIAADGATNRGGLVRITLTTGEVLEAHFEPLFPSMASWIHNIINFDTACKVYWGDKVGFGCFEATNNFQGGVRKPTAFDNATFANGWHPGVKRF